MAPTSTHIGIIGGGQLAWMMAKPAQELGLTLTIQTPHPSDPAVAVADHVFLGTVDDPQVTAAMAQGCDSISFENEFIDLSGLKKLEAEGVRFYPQIGCLAPLLDKYSQRLYCQQIGLPTPKFVTIESQEDLPKLEKQAAAVGWPLVLKTRRHGYDGQGTFILKNIAELRQTWQQLAYQPVLLEAFVPFERELAVMVARCQAGNIGIYPVVESQQVNQVCQRVIAPAAVDSAVAETVSAMATRFVEHLGATGIFGIELFLTAAGEVLVNEIAPRTHNSGHYTLDACQTSQFAQQLRAVSGLPLGSTAMTCGCALMVNLLGFESSNSDYSQQRTRLAQLPQAHLYWYGKRQSRPGRKLGHITLTFDEPQSSETLQHWIHTVESLWYPQI